MKSWLRNITSQSVVWPEIDAELGDLKQRGILQGTVLNAGSGWRDISHLVDGTVVNQDLSYPGDTRTNVDIYSPLDNIPRPDETFDGVLCIAVLEHVEDPHTIIRELYRVTKAGGYIVCSVPFLQPEHKVPTDFQRYTRDGLETLVKSAGYEVLETIPLYTAWHSLHWIVFETLNIKSTFLFKVLRVLILPPLAYVCRRSDLVSDKTATCFRVLARRPTNQD